MLDILKFLEPQHGTQKDPGVHRVSHAWSREPQSPCLTRLCFCLINLHRELYYLGLLTLYINEKRHDPNNTALSEVPCVSPLTDLQKMSSPAPDPTHHPSRRGRTKPLQMKIIKTSRKKERKKKKKNTKNHRVPHSNYFKACLVEKLFLPTLNPLCCTVSPPPPVWISGELQKSLP